MGSWGSVDLTFSGGSQVMLFDPHVYIKFYSTVRSTLSCSITIRIVERLRLCLRSLTATFKHVLGSVANCVSSQLFI